MVKDMETNLKQNPSLIHVATSRHLTYLPMFPQVKTGVVMNILGVLATSLAMNTWGIAMFDLGTYPTWAHTINKTAFATDRHDSSFQLLNATLG